EPINLLELSSERQVRCVLKKESNAEPLLRFDHVTKEFDLNKNWFGKPSNTFRAVNEVTWQV
ncbi:MAG: hypothetical protein VXW29_11600, partial [SAR324 cluster bacterium]|nr:hypothetical protein [SAR324 cluster bacterium]